MKLMSKIGKVSSRITEEIEQQNWKEAEEDALDLLKMADLPDYYV